MYPILFSISSLKSGLKSLIRIVDIDSCSCCPEWRVNTAALLDYEAGSVGPRLVLSLWFLSLPGGATEG